ncbi:hypothetical protein CDO27_34935 (plasmid) [Sinorhizobium meliloti]|nr:hypothetical protein CDO27_34935 [Sinorhizobium meliloti]
MLPHFGSPPRCGRVTRSLTPPSPHVRGRHLSQTSGDDDDDQRTAHRRTARRAAARHRRRRAPADRG